MDIYSTKFSEMVLASENRLRMMLAIIEAFEAKSFLEVGVWKGALAKRILKSSASIERYLMIDPWRNLDDWNKPFNTNDSAFEEIYNEAMLNIEPWKSKVKALRGTTKEMVGHIPDASLDMIYIDGDHTLRGITHDLILTLPKVKPGGLIMCDDFNADPWTHGAEYEPTLVCPFSLYFAEAHSLATVALPYRQLIIQNVRIDQWSFLDIPNCYSDLSLNRPSPLNAE